MSKMLLIKCVFICSNARYFVDILDIVWCTSHHLKCNYTNEILWLDSFKKVFKILPLRFWKFTWSIFGVSVQKWLFKKFHFEVSCCCGGDTSVEIRYSFRLWVIRSCFTLHEYFFIGVTLFYWNKFLISNSLKEYLYDTSFYYSYESRR